jgi:hypothetical protein
MSHVFCCFKVTPYKNQILAHEPKFREYLSWGHYPKESSVDEREMQPLDGTYVVMTGSDMFVVVDEKWLIDANFAKLNA